MVLGTGTSSRAAAATLNANQARAFDRTDLVERTPNHSRLERSATAGEPGGEEVEDGLHGRRSDTVAAHLRVGALTEPGG